MPLNHLSLEALLLARAEIEKRLKKIIPFKRLYIYDATHPEDIHFSASEIYVKEEKKALIPINIKEGHRHILHLEGIEGEDAEKIYPLIPSILELIVENIHLREQTLRDRLSGAYNLYSFAEKITTHIENFLSLIQERNLISSEVSGEGGEFCVVAVRIKEIGERLFSLGIDTVHSIISNIFQSISLYLDGGGEIGFNSLDIFYIFLKGRGNRWEKKLSGLKTHLEKRIGWTKYLPSPPHISLTYLSYPSDLEGWVLKRSPKEVASSILSMCNQSLKLMDRAMPDIDFFAVSETIKWGGTIEEILEDKRVVINMGKEMGIKVGTYFGVIEQGKQVPVDPQDLSLLLKAEIVIIQSLEGSCLGETLFLKDPRDPIKKGDKILLLKDEEVSIHELTLPPTPGHFLRMPQFIMSFYTLCRQYNTFSLLLLRTHIMEQKSIENLIRSLPEQAKLIGEYGTEGYILFFPDTTINTHHPIYDFLQRALSSQTNILGGIANYPCLHFNKYEAISNARAALEHASLLRPPKLAIFDSITLTLKGDREFLKGNVLGAVSEYKAALAMDPQNHIARNSLGICYAHLGCMEKALREFKKLSHKEESLPYLYNLASVHIKLKNYARATELLLKCLTLDPNHLYTLLRLGKLSEIMGDLNTAKKWYKRIPIKSYPPALRYLATIYLKEGNISAAQEYLEEAISLNPMDAEAIFLLGKIYAEHKKDPDIALVLIKKSTELRPDKIAYKQFLSLLNSPQKNQF